MPYTGADDPKLPKAVLGLSVKKRSQWVAVFNSVFGTCMGKPGAKKASCESAAFAQAYGVVNKKESAMDDKDATDSPMDVPIEEGEKYLPPGDVGTMVEIAPPLLGGAQSFTEAESYDKTQEQKTHVFKQEDRFYCILKNIMADPDKTSAQKAAAVESAAKELAAIVAKGPEKSLVDKIKGLFSPNSDKTVERTHRPMLGSFQTYKGLNGEWRWLTVTTNNFKDLEGEIFSEDAHKDYINYVDITGSYPELRLWHVKGSRIGMADFAAFSDGFVVHSGTFEDRKVAECFAGEKALGVSHGYEYKGGDEEDGVYDFYRTFEVSALPLKRAANALTDFVASDKEVTMFTADKRKFLVDHIGEERTALLEKGLAGAQAAAKDAGIAFKELVEDVTVEPAVPTDDKASEPVEDPATKEETPAEKAAPVTMENVQETAQAAVASALEAAIAPVAKLIEGLQKSFDEKSIYDEARLTALERTDEEKLAEKMRPRRQDPANGGGGRPTASKDNIPTDEEVKEEIVTDPKPGPVDGYADDLRRGRVAQEGGPPVPAVTE